MWRTCRPPARWSCSTAAGTTAPAWSTSWASAPRTSTRSSCAGCPQFERDLLRSGIILVKYWLSVSNEEQERRFKARLHDPAKQWKLSGLDLEARTHWVDYAEAKDEMFAYTDTRDSPWYVVEADDKRTMRLNLISHLLSLIPYEHVRRPKVKLPPRQNRAYVRPPRRDQNQVPLRYVVE